MRCALYFGSFNPLHKGHIAIAKYVMENCNVESVRLVLSPQSPFKDNSILQDPNQRLEELQKSIARFNKEYAAADEKFQELERARKRDELQESIENLESERIKEADRAQESERIKEADRAQVSERNKKADGAQKSEGSQETDEAQKSERSQVSEGVQESERSKESEEDKETNIKRLEISTIEFNLPRPNYTYNTLQYLKKLEPQNTFLLVMGADNLAVIEKWYKGLEILQEFEVLVYPRTGFDTMALCKKYGATYLNAPLNNISSTMIREGEKSGQDMSSLRY